ncbi:PTS fructose transporter subunit EIIBC, partial [filamentous cyanobacterium CCP1]
MKNIVAVTACPTGIAHTLMAAEALKKTAAHLGYAMQVETQGAEGAKHILQAEDIAAADLVIIAADIYVDPARFADKPIYATSTSKAIRDTEEVIEAAVSETQLESNGSGAVVTSPPEPAIASNVFSDGSSDVAPSPTDATPAAADEPKRLVGITACPTGIAHTFMAAEALRKAAVDLGHDMKVETQGSVGAKNTLTPEDIAQADAVVIAADTHVDLSRFGGKRVYQTSTKKALKEGKTILNEALAMPEPAVGSVGTADSYADSVKQAKAEQSAKRSGPYKHLLTGVSYMLPIIVAGGLILAISFAFGLDPEPGSIGDALIQIGGDGAFA